jgi:hypothetical protein
VRRRLRQLVWGKYDFGTSFAYDFENIHNWPDLAVWVSVAPLVLLISSSRQSSLSWTLAGWSVFAFVQSLQMLNDYAPWMQFPAEGSFDVTLFVVPVTMMILAVALRRRSFGFMLEEIDLRNPERQLGRWNNRLP